MKARAQGRPIAGPYPDSRGLEGSRAGYRVRSAVESTVLAGLLVGAVVAAMVGSGQALFFVVTTAWLALTVIVGPRNVLDAGCFFMLVTVGIVLIVDLVHGGVGSLPH